MNDKYIELSALLDFNKETGRFNWKSIDAVRTRFHNKSAGSIYKDGYEYIRHNNKLFLSHRLAWLKFFGEMPSGPLDHINMVRSDNRIENLRQASVSENNRNKRMQSNNTSGYKGVTFHKASGKYQAKICVNKKRISIGYFNELQEAASAYQQAVKEHHGEFARYQ